jgi:FAD/FMN-containing dehydrogenase
MLEDMAARLGAQHVLTGADAAPYGRDWTGAFVSHPMAVLRPADTAQVSAILRAAQACGQPVVPVSGNTGLSGGTMADGAVMISLERLRAIREIKPAARIARVEAGVVLSELYDAAAAQGLVFPMTFGAKGSARLGGMLSTNAGGSNVLRYGTMRDLCLGIEAVLPNGDVLDAMTELHKNNTGYDLRHLLIGAEGTLGVVTGAVLKVVPAPKARATAFIGLRSLPPALELLNALQEATGGAVEAFEYMPAVYHAAYARHAPGAVPPLSQDWPVTILAEIASPSEDAAERLADGTPRLEAQVATILSGFLESGLIADATLAQSERQRAAFWARREAAAEVTFTGRPLVIADIALPLDAQAAFLDAMEARLPGFGAGAESFPIAHLGDGNLHYVVWIDREDAALKTRITEAIEDEVARFGGTFSAEHGIGMLKRGTMARRKDPVALAAMRAIKAALDPQDLCNRGKLLP